MPTYGSLSNYTPAYAADWRRQFAPRPPEPELDIDERVAERQAANERDRDPNTAWNSFIRQVLRGETDEWLGGDDQLPSEYNLARNRPDIQQAMLQPSARQAQADQFAFMPPGGGAGGGGGKTVDWSNIPTPQGNNQPDIRDLQAFRYWSNLGNKGQNRNQVSPLFGALVGNQLSGLLNYGSNVADPVNRAWDLNQIASAMTAPSRAARDIAKIEAATDLRKSREKTRVANKLVDAMMSGGFAGAMGIPTGMQTDYGAGVQNPGVRVIRNPWQQFRR